MIQTKKVSEQIDQNANPNMIRGDTKATPNFDQSKGRLEIRHVLQSEVDFDTAEDRQTLCWAQFTLDT